ncbi:MAG: glycosyltransferase [Nocardioides sp.]|nr:glycosyltransferase [Nocardioides sp.]
MKSVEIAPLPFNRLGALIGPDRYEPLLAYADRIRHRMGDHVIWNVNATATGGGVAEMLQTLLAYAKGLGLDTRWSVLDGDPEFFAITKRIHNFIHGSPGDGGDLGEAEHAHYEAVLAHNAAEFLGHVRPGDVVLLHDPQTVGLAAALKEAGIPVVFRSHIGKDEPDDLTRRAWDFLQRYLEPVDGIVVSRATYAPPGADPDIVTVIPPSIDPFSAKNYTMPADHVDALLARVGLFEDGADRKDVPFARRDGSTGHIRDHGDLFAAGSILPEGTPYVLQVSRWDRLKDMPGVLTAFADHVHGHDDVHLLLVGPATAGVTDDPEGAQVLQECVDLWHRLPEEKRRRVHLVEVPMDDIDENAVIINALQSRAAVVVQKSLMEGFGLTVAEAMWKARPVIASRIGGIQDQVEHGVSGLLLDDPTDLAGLGALIQQVLDDPAAALTLGVTARTRVLDRFLGDRHLMQYGRLIERVLPPETDRGRTTTGG